MCHVAGKCQTELRGLRGAVVLNAQVVVHRTLHERSPIIVHLLYYFSNMLMPFEQGSAEVV
jgi:hypothetical protein